MNTTTIQIEKPTKELLDRLKSNYSVKTYDEVLKALIKKKHSSMYGVLKNANFTTKKAIKEIREYRNAEEF